MALFYACFYNINTHLHIYTLTHIYKDITTQFTHLRSPSMLTIMATQRIDWANQIADVIDVEIEYPILQLTHIYNPFRPWIIKTEHPNSTFKIGSILHIVKFNLETYQKNNRPERFIRLEEITKVDHDFITFHASTNPATMGSSIYIKIPTKWTKLNILYSLKNMFN